MAIHSAKKVQIALFVVKKVQILFKYLDFSDIFLKKKTLVLLKATYLNKYAIKLKTGQQSLHKPIYNLGLKEFKTLKTYIITNLANNFI